MHQQQAAAVIDEAGPGLADFDAVRGFRAETFEIQRGVDHAQRLGSVHDRRGKDGGDLAGGFAARVLHAAFALHGRREIRAPPEVHALSLLGVGMAHDYAVRTDQPHILEQGEILGQTFQRLLHAGPQGSSLLIRRGSEKVVDARNIRAVVQHIAQQTGHAFQLAGFAQGHHVEVLADLRLQRFFRADIAEPGNRAEPQQRGQQNKEQHFGQ